MITTLTINLLTLIIPLIVGKVVAKFCAKYLHQQVLKNEAYSAGDVGTSVQKAFFRFHFKFEFFSMSHLLACYWEILMIVHWMTSILTIHLNLSISFFWNIYMECYNIIDLIFIIEVYFSFHNLEKKKFTLKSVSWGQHAFFFYGGVSL